MALYERSMSRLMTLLAASAFFSDREEHDRLWVRCIEPLATRAQERSGSTVLIDMQHYPTLLALYALALGALAADRANPIARALAEITVQDRHEPAPVAVAAASFRVLDHDLVKRALDGFERRRTPISDHLWDLMGPVMSGIVSDQHRLEDLFDEAECLMSIAYATHGIGPGPIGRAVWRTDHFDRRTGTLIRRHAHVLVEAGLFPGVEHVGLAIDAYDENLRSWRHRL